MKKASRKPFLQQALHRSVRIAVLVIITIIVAAPGLTREKLTTIAIDPGHGGSDHGVTGPSNILEKDVTLIVAELIVKELQDKYRIVLTRTGDYHLGLYERTAIANNQDADLFISIHAGGSFSKQATGLHVYYFKNPWTEKGYTDTELPDPVAAPTVMTRWDGCQALHTPASLLAATSIFKRVSEPFISAAVPLKVNMASLPLAVLSGADMPALLIEIGYLTNPEEERHMANKNYLFEIAVKISRGIVDFLQKKDSADE